MPSHSTTGPTEALRVPGATANTWHRFTVWFVEARSHRVICLVAGVWLLNAFDLAITLVSHQQGLLVEQNPLARHMLGHGPLSVMLYKVGLVLIGSYPLLRFRSSRIAELGSLLVLAAYAVLAIHWSQCVELYSLTITNPANFAEIERALLYSP